ncbi:MAG: hypothetical protein P4M11_04095 [Candidatus Pacebacteria bacterium]|nr:hypothetical protein [Candidatus Paceibacterota bacterium]
MEPPQQPQNPRRPDEDVKEAGPPTISLKNVLKRNQRRRQVV